MSIEYESILELANESLQSESCREVDLRNSISKSYYYMYHSACRLTLGKVGKKDSSGKAFIGGVHKRFSSYLTDNAAAQHGFDEKGTIKVGLFLKQIHALRISADYHLTQNINRETAEMALRRASDTEKLIKHLLETRQ